MKQKIKSFKDACRHLRLSTKLPEVGGLMQKHQNAVIAFYKLSVIISALNDGWEPDWNDYTQKKWINWFSANSGSNAGFVTSTSYTSPSYTSASLGSRLCFKSQELAEYAAAEFLDLYNDYLTQPAE